jgi:hypothetical protein
LRVLRQLQEHLEAMEKNKPQIRSKRFRLEFQKGSDWSSKKVQTGVPKRFRLEFQKGSYWSTKKVQTGVLKSFRLEVQKGSDWTSKQVARLKKPVTVFASLQVSGRVTFFFIFSL